MSSIDERVVQMKFENAQFEHGVKQTINSLNTLDKSLNLQQAAAQANMSLSSIARAANSVNFNSLNGALDSINYRFSTLGQVAASAIETVTSGLLKLAKSGFDNTVGKYLTQIISGGETRAENLEQAKFMMEGLGINVEKGMANALEAVKGTAYGLDSAAKAVGQLSASGVKLGKDMTNTLQGIAGTAAMTGRDFDSVAQIFETVAGNGRLMGMQLTQLSSYGINAAQIIGKSLGKTEAEVRDLTSKGQISFAQFKDAMNDAFGEHAKEANKTFSGAVMNMNAALSRIGEPFQTAKMENLRQQAIALTEVFDQIGEATKPFAETFNKIMKHMRKGFVESMSKVSNVFQRLNGDGSTFEKISTIIYRVFKQLTSVFANFKSVANAIFPNASIEKFTGFIDRLYKLSDKINIKLKDAKRGITTNSKAMERFRNIVGGFMAVIDLARQGIIILAKVLRPIFKAIGNSGTFKAIAEFFSKIGKALINLDTKLKTATDFWDKLTQWSHTKLDFTNVLGGFFKMLAGIKSGNKIFDKLIDRVEKFKEFARGLSEKGLSFSERVEEFRKFNSELGIGQAFLTSILAFLSSVRDGFKAFGDNVKQAFSNAKKNFTDGFTNMIKEGLSGGDWAANNLALLKGMSDNLIAGVSSLGEKMHVIGEAIANVFVELAKKAANSIKGFGLDDLKKIVEIIKEIIKVFVGVQFVKLIGNINAMAIAIRQLMKDFGVTIQGSFVTNMKIITSGILKLAFAMLLLAIIPKEQLLQSLSAVTVLSILVVGLFKAMKQMSNGFTISEAAAVSSTLSTITSSMFFIAIAAAIMAQSDPEKLITAVAGMVVIMFAMEKFVQSMNRVAKSMKGSKSTLQFVMLANSLIPLAFAMNIFAIAIKILQAGKPEKTILGVLAFAGMLGIIFTFINQIDNSISKVSKIVAVSLAMMPLAIALTIMTGVVAILGHIDPTKLMIGFTALSGILLVLSLFSNSIKQVKGILGMAAAILIISGAMSILAISVAALGKLNVDQLEGGVIGIASIAVVLIVLANAFKNIKSEELTKSAVGMIAMSFAIIIISKAFVNMSNLDPKSLIVSTIALGGCVAALTLLAIVFKSVKVTQILGMTVAMVSFAITIRLIAGAFKEMDGLEHGIKSMIIMSVAIVAMAAAVLILGSASAQAILGSISLLLIASSVTVLAKAFTEFDKLKTPWKTFGLIAASIATLAGFSIMLGIISPILLIASAGMGLFSKALVRLAQAFVNMADAYDKCNGKMQAMADEFISALVRVARGLGDVGDAFKESLSRIIDNAIEIFISKIPALADAIWQMFTQLSNAFGTYAPAIADNLLDGLTTVLNVIAENLWNGGGIVNAMDNLGSAFMTAMLRSLASGLSDDHLAHPLQATLRDLLLGTADEKEANAALAREQGKEAVENLREGAEAAAAGSSLSGGITSFLGSGAGLDFSSMFGGADLSSFLSGLDLSSTDADGLMSSLTGALGDSGAPMMENLGDNLGKDGVQSLLDQFNNGDIDLTTFTDKLSSGMELEKTAEEEGREFNRSLKSALEKNAGNGGEGAKKVRDKIKKQFGKGSKEMERLGEAGGKNYIDNLLKSIENDEISVETAVSRLNDILSGKNLPEGYGALTNKAIADIEDSQKLARLETASETLGQQGIVDPLKNSIESDEAISAISGAGDNATNAASGTETAQSALYSQMYDKGKNATQGLADGLMDSQAVAAVQMHAVAVARKLLDGINKTLDEHSPSKETQQQGIYAVMGLAMGLEDKASNKRIVKSASTMAKQLTGTIQTELDIHSPSRKMMKIAQYAAEGFTKGLSKMAKKKAITSTAKRVSKSITSTFSKLGKHITKSGKKLIKKFKDISKQLQLDPDNKKLQKKYVKLEKQVEKLVRRTNKKYGANVQLFESTDEYADLKEQLKEQKKIQKNTKKKAKKWAKKNNIDTDDVKNLKSMEKLYKKLNKSNDKADKNRAKKLKKYIDTLKDANKEVKQINKDLEKGYRKAVKEWKKSIKEMNKETYHSAFLESPTKTFEIFASGASKSVDVLSASADKLVDILTTGSSSASDSVKILTNSIGRMTDVLQASYDTSIDLFNEFQTEWYNPSEFISDMEDNAKGYEKWREGLAELKSTSNGKEIAKVLEDSGFSSTTLSQLTMYLNMLEADRKKVVDLLDRKLTYEKDQYVSNMEKTVSDYQTWSDNISSLTGKVRDDVLEKLESMGVEGAKYVEMFMKMDESDLATVYKQFDQEATQATNMYFKNVKKQLTQYSKWQSNLEELAKPEYGISDEFLEDLKSMGVEGAEYVEQLLKMSDTQRSELSSLYSESLTAQANSYLDDLRAPIDQFETWIDDLAKLEKEGKLSESLLKELKAMGAEGYEIVKKFSNMSDEAIAEANALYSKQMGINAENYLLNMRNEVDTYKTWTENLATLESKGLDKRMVQELLAAGVESADKVEELLYLVENGQLKAVNEVYQESQKANANSLLNSMRSDAKSWQDYYSGISWVINNTDIDSSIIQKLKDMGLDALDYIYEIKAMSEEEINELNKYAEAEQTITSKNLLLDIRDKHKKISEWGDLLKEMAEKGFNSELIQELAEQGYEASYDAVKAYSEMSKSEVGEVNSFWESNALAQQKAAEAIKESAGNTSKAYDDAMKAYAKNGATTWSDAAKAVATIFGDTVIEVGENYNEKWIDTTTSWFKNAIDAVTEVVGTSTNTASKTMYKAQVLMGSKWVEMIVPDKSLLYKYGSVKNIEEVVQTIGNTTTSSIGSYSQQIKDAVIAAISPYTNGTSTAMSNEFVQMAVQCVSGMSNSFNSSTSRATIQRAVNQLICTIPTTVRNLLGIHSPSRLMYELGTYTTLGFANSLFDGTEIVKNAATTMITDAVTAVQDIATDSSVDLGIQPVFDSASAATGLAAIDEMINAKQLAVQSLSFDNVSDINSFMALNDSLNNLTSAITGMESYGERLSNIEALLGTYLPDATTDIYLDGAKVSSYVENTIANNIVRRRAGW